MAIIELDYPLIDATWAVSTEDCRVHSIIASNAGDPDHDGRNRTWMTAPAEELLKLQRPLPDETLKIVARGEKNDEAA